MEDVDGGADFASTPWVGAEEKHERPRGLELLTLPLVPGVSAELSVLLPMTELEWSRMIGMLNAMRAGMVEPASGTGRLVEVPSARCLVPDCAMAVQHRHDETGVAVPYMASPTTSSSAGYGEVLHPPAPYCSVAGCTVTANHIHDGMAVIL